MVALIRLWGQAGQNVDRFFRRLALRCEDVERVSAARWMRMKQAISAFLQALSTAGRALGL